MFWLGEAIALLAGTAGIAFARDRAKVRFRWVNDLHLDLIAFVLLVLGLGLSAIDHIRADRQIASLERSARLVRSFEIDVDLQFISNWTGSPPTSPRVLVGGRFPAAKAEIVLLSGEVKALDLYMDRDPSFSPGDDGWVHTVFRVRAEPGSWVLGSDAAQLADIRKLTFQAYGVRLQDSRDGNFTLGHKSRLFVNGRQAAKIVFEPQSVALNQLALGGNSPELMLEGPWPIHGEWTGRVMAPENR